ncbi:MAG TPA: cache domain-containing protein, partial [Desulforhopalus sp.]|nr:cache domain-containing protein [Desulforhopalus sp.]
MDKRQLIRMVCSFVVPPVLVLLLFTMAIGLFILPSTENALMQRKKDTVRAVVATATSIIERHAEAVRQGEIALAAAQQLALAEMRAVRFGGEMQEYLWITDQQPVMLMHPYYPELEGTWLNTYSDSRGKKLFVDAVELTSENHEGFIDYIWTKGRNGEVLAPKLS